MAITFIHTGDWHIAKPYGRFDPDKQALLREARARIVERVGALAYQQGADAVLVAGDVFDTPLVADEVLRKLAARLDQFKDIQWHFLPGNHDPATPNGVWQRFARIATGDHVTIHHQPGLQHMRDGIDLLVAPLKARAIAHDPTEWMADRPSDTDIIRIGLAHGAVQGFGSAGEASVLIAPDRAVGAKLDYLALGDWHGMRQVGPKAWYAGTPEPDQFPDNEPGYALSVRIAAAGAEPEVNQHRLGQYHWQRHALGGNLVTALDDLEQTIANAGSDAANMLLQLTLAGRVTLDEEHQLRARIQRLEDRAFHVDVDDAELKINIADTDPDSFKDPLLSNVAGRLAANAEAEGPDADVAIPALRLLSEMTHRAEDAA